MIDPSGRLPHGVYWRRRMAAVAMSVVAVVLLAWVIGKLVDGGGPNPVQGASARSAQPPSTRSTSEASSRASASSSASVAEPAAPAPAQPAQPPPPPAPPPPPQPCPDPAITVYAETEQPGYRVGERPLLRLLIVNASTVACYRDVSRSIRELVITTPDGTRVWSSNDCYSPPGEEIRLIQPGEKLLFTVNWAGRTSAPGCPSQRRTVPAGSYLVTGKLGAVTGAPVPLELSK